MSSINLLQTPTTVKHREAGKAVVEAFEEAIREIHLEIKKRGKVTTWAARRARSKNYGS